MRMVGALLRFIDAARRIRAVSLNVAIRRIQCQYLQRVTLVEHLGRETTSVLDALVLTTFGCVWRRNGSI